MAGPNRIWWHRPLRWLITIAIAVFAWFALQRLIGRIDWAAVGTAFMGIAGWSYAPLLLFLLLRQTFNAVPLTYYVPGLGLRRSLLNDITANLAATVAPTPSDVVIRVAMFRSWGVDPVAGMTGVTLNSAKFYAIRFVAPVIGLLLVGVHELEARQWLLALACGVAATALPLLEVVGALMLLYPFTLLPLVGLGVLDAMLVGALTAVAGSSFEADIVAGVLVWRVTTILGTLALGLLSLGWWRLTTKRHTDVAEHAP